ncbi:MAG: methylenetetrahydrofolate reductase [Candidatus Omnitrophica bacterium]|nr:methylenetetrahydrofolate reductase [Candidatus Omnitrophota bacterium]MBI3020751.1 methylenetetrahydrofolate reductase [Candidatus Omnitrophota bacterium]
MEFPESNRFETKLGKKPFLVTMEVNPPKGTDLSGITSSVGRVKGLVDAVNVTDGSGAIMRASPLAVAKAVLDAGLDPILQMTCRDRNRLALQADLLGASILGIRNVLLLTGDDPKAGDHPDAKPVFDINSATLMQAAKGLTEGKDMAGKPLLGAPRFCIGAAADPGAKDLEVEMQKFQAKLNGGAQFFQTQAVFDPARLGVFMGRARPFGKPVLAGILLVKSANMARYMNEHVWGIHVPDEIIARFERSGDKRAECVAVTGELIRAVRELADGIHLYALGWEDLVPDILKEAKLGGDSGDSQSRFQ